MKMKLSLCLIKASPQVLLVLKYFDIIFLITFLTEKGLTLLSQHAAFENGHTLESINLMVNNFINVSKLHIIRQKKDCTSDGIHYIYSNLSILRF